MHVDELETPSVLIDLDRMACYPRLARDYKRLPEMLRGLYFLAFAMLMAHRCYTGG